MLLFALSPAERDNGRFASRLKLLKIALSLQRREDCRATFFFPLLALFIFSLQRVAQFVHCVGLVLLFPTPIGLVRTPSSSFGFGARPFDEPRVTSNASVPPHKSQSRLDFIPCISFSLSLVSRQVQMAPAAGDAVGTATPSRPRRFHEAFHHPVIHVVQHTISPLTASLLIFSIHKAWQIPAMAATIRASRVLFQAGLLRPMQVVRPRLLKLTAGCAGVAGAYEAWKRAPTVESNHRLSDLAAIYEPGDAPQAAHSLSSMWTTAYITEFFRGVRSASGLPWWATIACATLCLRVMLAPINVALLRNSLRIKLILPQLNRLGDVLKSVSATREAKIDAALELQQLLLAAKCTPWAQTMVFPALLPPMILSVFGAVYNLCIADPLMAIEGLLWFPDLIAQDKTQLLAILSALTWLCQVEIGAGSHYQAWPALRLTARLMAVSMISLSATLPSGVFVFWITSNLFAVARGQFTRLDPVRRFLRIPLQREIDALTHIPVPRGM